MAGSGRRKGIRMGKWGTIQPSCRAGGDVRFGMSPALNRSMSVNGKNVPVARNASAATATLARLAVIAALLLVTVGCRTSERARDGSAGPKFAPSNYAREEALPTGFFRVAVLPFHYEEGTPDLWLADLEAVFRGELAGSGRFEVVPVSRSAMADWTGKGSFASFERIGEELFEALAREYAVDGILFTDLFRYSAYRPLVLGVRSKLVTADGRIIWAIDELLDAGRPDVARGARAFSYRHARMASPLDSSNSVLQSPSRFGKYAAYTLYETLPSH